MRIPFTWQNLAHVILDFTAPGLWHCLTTGTSWAAGFHGTVCRRVEKGTWHSWDCRNQIRIPFWCQTSSHIRGVCPPPQPNWIIPEGHPLLASGLTTASLAGWPRVESDVCLRTDRHSHPLPPGWEHFQFTSHSFNFLSVSGKIAKLVNTVIYLLVFGGHSFSGQWELTLPTQVELKYINLIVSLDFKS